MVIVIFKGASAIVAICKEDTQALIAFMRHGELRYETVNSVWSMSSQTIFLGGFVREGMS